MAPAWMMPMAFTALIYMQLEQCRMVVCKFIAAVQYMHVLRQLCRGFCTIVLHLYCYTSCAQRMYEMIMCLPKNAVTTSQLFPYTVYAKIPGSPYTCNTF